MAFFLVVVLLLGAPSLLPEQAGAGDLPDVSGLCGEGFNPVVLCGLQEALCVPDGCGVGCVSCCPPSGPCEDDDDDCPDQNAPECMGGICSCDSSCASECFTVSVNGTMAPMLGRAPLAILLVSLFAGGLWLARSRASSRR